jgi:hypothetical protein
MAFRGHFDSLRVRLGLGRSDAHSIVGFNSPALDRMSLADIHGHELDPIAVLAAEVVKGPKLGPERPSREAASDTKNAVIGASGASTDHG